MRALVVTYMHTQLVTIIMATKESEDVEMKDVEREVKPEVDPKQAQIDKDLLTFEGIKM